MAFPLESIRELRESISRVERDLIFVKEQMAELKREAMGTPPSGAKIRALSKTVKPRSQEVTCALERAAQLAEELRGLPKEERRARFFQNLEKIREQAIEKDMAMDDEREAAILYLVRGDVGPEGQRAQAQVRPSFAS